MGVTKILLTNRNHSRAANVVRTRTGAKTLIHPDDAAHARSQGAEIDGELSAGESIGPLTIVAVPGKSPGEVALHWPERRLLIVGDAVIGNPPGQCGLLREKVMDDPARLQGKRTQAARSGIRHAALRRRGVDPPRRESAVEGAGRYLSGRVKPGTGKATRTRNETPEGLRVASMNAQHHRRMRRFKPNRLFRRWRTSVLPRRRSHLHGQPSAIRSDPELTSQSPDAGVGRADAGVGMQISLFVFDRAPQSSHEHVVAPTIAAVHADRELVHNRAHTSIGGTIPEA